MNTQKRPTHATKAEQIKAVASFRDGKSLQAVAKKHKVSTQTVTRWNKTYKEILDLDVIGHRIKSLDVDSYIEACTANPECVFSIELGPEAYEMLLHVCKIEERSMDGQIRYLIKQCSSMHSNHIPF